jgi:hypothetical protein
MCFSASASFTAGIVLSAIGIVSVRKAENRSQAAFAVIPLIFAVQQITEGCLWLALTDTYYASLQWPATYLFLFFAQVVWPFWVPFAILRLEKEQKRKNSQRILLAAGAVVSAYLAFCLVSYNVEARITDMHISYQQDYPSGLSRYGGLLYILATIVPPFISSVRRMWTLGTAILISYIITSVFYTEYVVSVWCFFASIISIAVWGIMSGMKTSREVILSDAKKEIT